MANLKNITDLPVAESAEGLNLIVNDNGAAKQIAAGAVGAQANWNVEDASSPAYILNKPEIPAAQVQADWTEADESSMAFIKNKPGYDAVIKIEENYGDGNDICNIIVEKGTLNEIIAMIRAGKKPRVLFYGVLYYGQALPIAIELDNMVVFDNSETGQTEIDFMIHWMFGSGWTYEYKYKWTPNGVEYV